MVARKRGCTQASAEGDHCCGDEDGGEQQCAQQDGQNHPHNDEREGDDDAQVTFASQVGVDVRGGNAADEHGV